MGSGTGDDIPKFMERSVGESDRVLVVCTPNYVKRADEGRGGVGYEAMIVTAELVKDLGSAKFVPVIREKDPDRGAILPTCLSTRRYVDLSDDERYASGFEELLHDLHEMRIAKKPPLGDYSKFEIDTTKQQAISVDEIYSKPESGIVDLGTLYGSCVRAIRQSDTYSWRKIVQEVKIDYSAGLAKWFDKYSAEAPEDAQTAVARVLEAVDLFGPLICVALTGVESSEEKYRKQSAVIDEMLLLRNWIRSGFTVYTEVHRAAVFLYQAIHGAVSLETEQIELAFGLANSRVRVIGSAKTLQLWRQPDLVGWPNSFGGDAKVAWDALSQLPAHWPWLLRIFASEEDYRTSIAAYYLFLSIVEFLDRCEKGLQTSEENSPISLGVPPFFLNVDGTELQKSRRLLIANGVFLKRMIGALSVSETSIATEWGRWVEAFLSWRRSVFRAFYFDDADIATLIEEIMDLVD